MTIPQRSEDWSREAHKKMVLGIPEHDHVALATHLLTSHPEAFDIQGDYIAQRDNLAKLIEQSGRMFGEGLSLHSFHREGMHGTIGGVIESGPWEGEEVGEPDHEHVD
jgi:hypothetical protein